MSIDLAAAVPFFRPPAAAPAAWPPVYTASGAWSVGRNRGTWSDYTNGGIAVYRDRVYAADGDGQRLPTSGVAPFTAPGWYGPSGSPYHGRERLLIWAYTLAGARDPARDFIIRFPAPAWAVGGHSLGANGLKSWTIVGDTIIGTGTSRLFTAPLVMSGETTAVALSEAAAGNSHAMEANAGYIYSINWSGAGSKIINRSSGAVRTFTAARFADGACIAGSALFVGGPRTTDGGYRIAADGSVTAGSGTTGFPGLSWSGGVGGEDGRQYFGGNNAYATLPA